MTKQLIPVFIASIGDSPVNAIDARVLHTFLEVRSEFRHWIKNRISDYGFVQDIDYIAGNFLPGSDRIDYHCTISMGKELAMVERNAKGKQARQYFIECERRLLKSQPVAPQSAPVPAPINPLDIILQQHQIVGSALAEIKRHDIALVQMDERITNLETGYDATTVQKAKLYEEMLKVDEKTGIHLWHLRLRERMRALGMNQTRLSFLLGVNPSTVCRWVKGTAVPSLDMLERIGLAMGLSLIEFLSPDSDLDFTSPDLI